MNWLTLVALHLTVPAGAVAQPTDHGIRRAAGVSGTGAFQSFRRRAA